MRVDREGGPGRGLTAPRSSAVLGSFVEGFKTTLSAPLNTHFLSISNDQTGNRAWPKGCEIASKRRDLPAPSAPRALQGIRCPGHGGPSRRMRSPRYNEIKSRTIVPKFKDFDKKLRITGIPGFNFFGTPSSKQDTGPLKLD